MRKNIELVVDKFQERYAGNVGRKPRIHDLPRPRGE